jgi:hypothetical protein
MHEFRQCNFSEVTRMNALDNGLLVIAKSARFSANRGELPGLGLRTGSGGLEPHAATPSVRWVLGPNPETAES